MTASDPCLACGEEVAHRDSLYVTRYPGTQKNRTFIFCDWGHFDLWRAGVTPEVMERFKQMRAESEATEPTPDDFGEIRRRLIELAEETGRPHPASVLP